MKKRIYLPTTNTFEIVMIVLALIYYCIRINKNVSLDIKEWSMILVSFPAILWGSKTWVITENRVIVRFGFIIPVSTFPIASVIRAVYMPKDTKCKTYYNGKLLSPRLVLLLDPYLAYTVTTENHDRMCKRHPFKVRCMFLPNKNADKYLAELKQIFKGLEELTAKN